MNRRVTVRTYEGKRGTTWRLRWRHEGRTQSVTVGTKYDSEQAVEAIEALGCNIADGDPRMIGGLLWRGDIVEAEAMRGGMTFHAAALLHIAAKSPKKCKPTTKAGNVRLLDSALTELHDWPVAALTADDVNAWADVQLSTYKNSTVRERLTLVKSTLAWAHRKGYRADNPGPDIELPDVGKRTFHLKDAHVAAIMAHGGVWRDMWALLAETGLRIGEARALQVGDLDLDNPEGARLNVNRAMQGATRIFGPGKTKHALREIWLDDDTVRLLRALSLGKADDALVFHDKAGAPLRYQDVYLGWRETLRRAKVPKAAHIHDLRHWHLSALMADPTVPLIGVQQRAGHGSSRTTTDLYGHGRDETNVAMVASITNRRTRRLSAVG